MTTAEASYTAVGLSFSAVQVLEEGSYISTEARVPEPERPAMAMIFPSKIATAILPRGSFIDANVSHFCCVISRGDFWDIKKAGLVITRYKAANINTPSTGITQRL